MIVGYIHCCIPHCRRKTKAEKHPDSSEIICGRCWRTLDPVLRARYSQLRRRDRRIERLLRRKIIARKPNLDLKLNELDRLLRADMRANWERLKEDGAIKSNLRVEGTAGDLAFRRKA